VGKLRKVSKSIFINTLACPTLGWLQRHDEAKKEATIGDKFLIEQGIEIGNRARTLYPDGVFIEEKNPHIAAEITKNLIDNTETQIIYEGAFIFGDLVTRADILKREDDGGQYVGRGS
jgi:hypothetical protein